MPVLTLEQVEPPFAVSCSRIVNGAGERIRQYPWGTMNGPCFCYSVSNSGSLTIAPFIFGSYLSHVDSRELGRVGFFPQEELCTLMCVVSPGVSQHIPWFLQHATPHRTCSPADMHVGFYCCRSRPLSLLFRLHHIVCSLAADPDHSDFILLRNLLIG